MVRSQPENNSIPVPSKYLHRSYYVLFLALGYASMALFAWFTILTLAYKPIGADSYLPDYTSEPYYNVDNMARFTTTEIFLRAARMLQSVTSVFAIPLTSTVCSSAAVVYLQRLSGGNRPTLRHTMTLADKAWTDPTVVIKLLFGQWKKYGSFLLLVAIILNVLAASITPLQEYFVPYKIIKVPWKQYSTLIRDIPTTIGFNERYQDSGDGLERLRARLSSTYLGDRQSTLWSRDTPCVTGIDPSSNCIGAGRYTMFDLSRGMGDAFWAEMQAGSGTGMIQQFAPRFNFTSKHENITADEWPQNCGEIPGALRLHYEDLTQPSNQPSGYSVDICMPSNLTNSPLKPHRARQEFTEELYLNISILGDPSIDPLIDRGNFLLRATLDTTAGYFELPNYMNGQMPGPILDYDPTKEPYGPQYMNQTTMLSSGSLHPQHVVRDVRQMGNRGPLATAALALFGEGSALDIHHTISQAYADPNTTKETKCIDIIPIVPLFQKHGVTRGTLDSRIDPCITATNAQHAPSAIVQLYMNLFTGRFRTRYGQINPEDIENALTAIAFIAVDMWGAEFPPEFEVGGDNGHDLQIPNISLAGQVLISCLMGIYLSCILALAIYGTFTPRWTNQLDSFAMMRIGASMGHRFPLRLARDSSKIKDLDELPGWIGDVTGIEDKDSGGVGELGLGGQGRLTGRRKYHYYPDK